MTEKKFLDKDRLMAQHFSCCSIQQFKYKFNFDPNFQGRLLKITLVIS